VGREASEQMESTRGWQTVRRTTCSGREFKANRHFRPHGNVWDNLKMNSRALCEPLMLFIHSQIMTAAIEQPSRLSPGAPSWIDALRLMNSPRLTTHQPPQFSCAAEWLRCVTMDDGPRRKMESCMRQRSSPGRNQTLRPGVLHDVHWVETCRRQIRPIVSELW
jgi:hypothetical protein